MNFNKRNFDSSSEDEKFEKKFEIPKTVVLSSSLKPAGVDNQFLRLENGNRILLKMKESPQFPNRASNFLNKSDSEQKTFTMDSVIVKII